MKSGKTIFDKIEPELLCAAWLAPMTGPPLRDAAIVIRDGRVQDVGSQKSLRERHPDAKISDLGNSVILPGLVNAHTHLELSDCHRGPPPTNGFTSWLVQMLQRTRRDPAEIELATTKAIAIGIEQSLTFGVTTVGDISRQCRVTRPLLAQSPLRVVSYGEVQAMAQRRGLLEERVTIAADATFATPRLTIGITPHAPYSVEPDGYRRCLQTAREHSLPLATHLAETRDEATFLESHSGPLRDLWDQWLTWDDSVPKFTGGPIRYAQNLGLLNYPTLLAHVNYCDDNELKILASSKASVVYCPRTHEYFGHPPHRWREMLQRGINVAVGTDSCASSPNLDLVDDLRLLHQQAPDFPIMQIWEMATTRAAKAIGLNDAGILEPGSFADLIVFPCKTADPLREILEREIIPASVYVEGKQIT